MSTWDLVLWILAAICFLLAALPRPPVGWPGIGWLGLFLVALSVITPF